MSAVMSMNDYYAEQFVQVHERLPGYGLDWLDGLRRAAVETFERTGFPTSRDEDWKYTNVRSIQRRSFRMDGEACIGLVEDDLGAMLLEDLEAHRLVFVNGKYAPQLSSPGDLPRGATVQSLARTLADSPQDVEPVLARQADCGANGFAALNLAFFADGAFIRLAEGTRLVHPIHLLHVTTSQSDAPAHHVRNLVVAGTGSAATIIEHFVSLGDAVYLNNVVTEVVNGDAARIEHYKLQRESAMAYHVATLQVAQDTDSEFVSHAVSVGGALARHDINATLDAEGARCSMYGLYILDGRQHCDFHTRVDHKAPHGTSLELYKGVLAGKSRAVFNGKVHVHPDAQKTDARQSNKNLLLSRDSEVDTKPQLEIYADDVKCAHGATVGQLDENMLFYLRSRGVPEAAARGMLTYGFAHDVVELMDLPAVQHLLEDELVRKLPHAHGLSELL